MFTSDVCFFSHVALKSSIVDQRDTNGDVGECINPRKLRSTFSSGDVQHINGVAIVRTASIDTGLHLTHTVDLFESRQRQLSANCKAISFDSLQDTNELYNKQPN